ncbi:MAG: hypothetical protein KME31_09600 [Tolypothrix carrinoi HA7290-LM1]|nr:hypothetical protein [Tolypothrix carrinoi HA7290-LM1]
MGNCLMGNGNKKNGTNFTKGRCPMPHDGRCASAGKPLRQSLMGGTPKTALPMPTHCLPHAQCPITDYRVPDYPKLYCDRLHLPLQFK